MRNWILCFTLLAATTAWGQNDVRLTALFSPNQLENHHQNSPEVLEFWTFVANNGLEFMEVTAEKNANLDDLEIINFSEDFNLLARTELIGRVRNYFKDANTGQLVIVKSMTELTKGFNEDQEGKK